MATFGDVGKDVNDQFSKDLAKEQNVELSAKVNDYFSFLLKGNVKGDKVDATFAPTLKVSDYNVEVKPEFTTPDSKKKTYKLDVSINDVGTKGLKLELGTSNGTEGESSVGFVYKNAKFGGITGKISFPEGKDKFITPSIFIQNKDTKGFGIGANAKVVLGDSTSLEAYKALGSFKNDEYTSYFGVETKPVKVEAEEKKPAEKAADNKPAEKAADKFEPNFFVLGGFLKSQDNKQFGANGSYNTNNGKLVLEVLFRKNYADGTFLKLKGDIDGKVGVSKQFKPQSGVSLTLGTNVDVFSGKGNAGFQFSTDL